MLAGCSSSSLLSPTGRLRSEAVAATVSVHFPMNTQRLDLPCSSSFSSRKHLHSTTATNRLSARPVDVLLKQNINFPPLATTRRNTEGFSWNNDNNIGKRSLNSGGGVLSGQSEEPKKPNWR
ncbi:hypothetical protein IGI04_026113 [Brassica rapa subsp. trilocularis]|uniref:Uncharacterized protein n=2 Tax=Brassica TaxID=3705 RepID=A0ABQ8CKF9_BRANA|nr:hypothetical protein IGI04_026113 [Brassica rapa subsp. trilocularis]KAH0917508.1 hypothetical protein HID58_025168 [Brassica napus]